MDRSDYRLGISTQADTVDALRVPRLLVMAALAVACCFAQAQTATCESLLSLQIPDTNVHVAQSIPAGSYQPPGSATAFADLPEFCRVTATVSPVPGSTIGIEVWLPTTTWNGRYQQVGNHSFGGVFYWSEMAPQLRRGFVTAATDTGHTGGGAAWAIGHPESIVDYAWRAVHELAVKSKLLIGAYYAKPAQYAYFNGCSNGGRDGLKDAQMFEHDFNGILFGGAATQWTHAGTELLYLTQQLVKSGLQGAGGAAKLQMAQTAAVAACGGIDAPNGFIADPRTCHWDPHTLVCKSGQDTATCITPVQADALADIYKPLQDPVTGKWVMSGQEHGSEFDWINFGLQTGLAVPGITRYQIAFQDPAWNAGAFDWHADLPALDRVMGVINSDDPNLTSYKRAGGKLIQWHGWSDGAFTPGSITRYYDNVVERMGGLNKVQDFYRLFMLPGVGHCGNGPGPDNIGAENQTAVSPDPEHDAVSALMEWVEHGQPPGKLIATKLDNGAPTKRILLQRPICPYPGKTVYKGSGSTAVADNFYCTPAGQ